MKILTSEKRIELLEKEMAELKERVSAQPEEIHDGVIKSIVNAMRIDPLRQSE